MGINHVLFQYKNQKIWENIERKIHTLESFSQTETDAGESIKRALLHVENPTLRSHLLKHAEDELRHGLLFRNRAEALRREVPGLSGISKLPDKLYALSKENHNPEINSHGFFTSDTFENKGEIKYIAMLNVAEKKAEKLFHLHSQFIKNDPETYSIFKSILKDERYHVSYTEKYLQQWRVEGHQKEVKQALRQANESRILNAITRISAKFGQFMGSAILYILYFTVVVPFALLSKIHKIKAGWQSPQQASNSESLHSQY